MKAEPFTLTQGFNPSFPLARESGTFLLHTMPDAGWRRNDGGNEVYRRFVQQQPPPLRCPAQELGRVWWRLGDSNP